MKQVKTLTQLFLLCIVIGMLNACGFHLRGQTHFSPAFHDIYLNTNSSFTPLTQDIQQAMQDANVKMLTSPIGAKIILSVYDETQNQTLMTVGANQQTRQYQLTYSVTYTLKNADGKILLGPDTIMESRTQIIQANQLLINNTETNQLYDSMRQDAVIDLMYRLSSTEATTLINHALTIEKSVKTKNPNKRQHQPTQKIKT